MGSGGGEEKTRWNEEWKSNKVDTWRWTEVNEREKQNKKGRKG